jgi:beta-lactam-binding protein with PASTA domain
MLTLIIVLLVAAAVATFILTKKGKIADANQNHIPDVVEKKVEQATQAVEELVATVEQKVTRKANATKQAPAKKSTPAPKTAAKKIVKKAK